MIKQFRQRLIILLLTVLVTIDSYGQCTAHAGNDTSLCVSFGLDTFYLGGTPTVSGGFPPYQYIWSCNYTIGTQTKTASDYLDDTTKANPQLLNPSPDTLALYLTITDSLGNTCNDTIIVGFCQYAWTTDWKFVYINQGDTSQIAPSVGLGCPPLTFKWSPNYNISDQNVENPLVWPDTTVMYSATVTASAGCQAWGGSFDVFVTPTGIKEHDSHINIEIFPNPITDGSIIKIFNPNSQDLIIDFYDIFGRTIKQENISDIRTEIKLTGLSSGIYFYRLFENDRSVGQGKLIKE